MAEKHLQRFLITRVPSCDPQAAVVLTQRIKPVCNLLLLFQVATQEHTKCAVLAARVVWIVKTQNQDSCFPCGAPGVAFHEVHAARCELQGRISAKCRYHLWGSSSGLQSASSQQGNNWGQPHQTDPAHISDFFFIQAVILRGFSACMEIWETLRSAIPAICTPQILYGKVRKNDPSSQEVWIPFT